MGNLIPCNGQFNITFFPGPAMKRLPSTPPTRKTSDSSTSSTSTTNSQSNTIVGYLHNVSPGKKSAKGSNYFSFSIQAKERNFKAGCFSPKKHKLCLDQRAESQTLCKISTFGLGNEQNLILINQGTQINEALDANVDFCFGGENTSS
mgnify:CR=1 FL=1